MLLSKCKGTDGDLAQAPEPERHRAGADDEGTVDDIERDLQERDQAKLNLKFFCVVGNRKTCVSIFALGVGEQFHRQDIGIAIDHAPGEHGTRFRHDSRPFLDARHEVNQCGDESREPDQKRPGEPRVGCREQNDGAGDVDDHEPDGIGGLDGTLTQ